MDNTIYPPAVEEKLQMIVESSKQLRYDEIDELDENCVREVFGEVLMANWFAGDEDLQLEVDEIVALFNKAAATTLLRSLIDKGYIDTIEDEDGREMVFVTQMGRELMSVETQKTHNYEKKKRSKRRKD